MTRSPTHRTLGAAIVGVTLALTVAAPTVAVAAAPIPPTTTSASSTSQADAPRAALVRSAEAARESDGTYTLTWQAVPGVRSVDVFASPDPRQQGEQVATATGSRAVVPDLDPEQRWYFELVPAGQERGLPVAARELGLVGVPNGRDIGGYRTKDNRVVEWGSVFRTDTLSNATSTDVVKVGSLDLSQVIDFRSPAEIKSQGEDKLPAGQAYTPRPIYDVDDDFYLRVRGIIDSRDAELQRKALADGAAEEMLVEENRMYAMDPAAREHIGAVLRDLAASPEPLLYHCTAGKDRTGWMTAVLLEALGVDRETIFADYMLSNEYRAAFNQRTMDGLKASGVMAEPELIIPLLEVRREYLQAAYAEVDQNYGSFARYLHHGLGIDPATQLELREQLLVR